MVQGYLSAVSEATISVVVPVYKTEKYLERCIRSVICQAEFGTRVEMILVIDGSPDESLKVAQGYAERYPRIRVYSQPNKGLGAARNEGAKLATGQWIWFVDSDDAVRPGSLGTLLELIEEPSCDLIAFDALRVSADGAQVNASMVRWDGNGGETLSGAAFYSRNYEQSNSFLFLFRRDILQENHLKFLPRVNLQDSEFLPRYLMHSSDVRIHQDSLYEYTVRRDSFMNSRDVHVRVEYLRSMLEVRRRIGDMERDVHGVSLEMARGLRLKVRALDFSVFSAFVYEPRHREEQQLYVDELTSFGCFPPRFRPSLSSIRGGYRAVLLLLVSLMPRRFPLVFRTARNMARRLIPRELPAEVTASPLPESRRA